ncbi:homing endonuclease associated repeat-containing protein [Natronorubrum daqingense]|uniref:HNH endonuclease n=1 Tax=Natronorubrum daqingense TaxID=588898 RepID=A0A1N7E6I1_9EURY|nr:HNH endonuclease [Natronorubrum daqingense]APX96386.1 hypothetical protein BB347_07010 [Natronorubrum daqingense]SIR83605.1 HNH endonuclease [Natronorubrum daqingense]
MDTIPTKERLIEDLQSFAEEVDGVPTVRGMRNDGPHSPHHYKQEFGTWHDALRAADIQPTHGVTPDVDRDALVTELQKVNEITERPPRRADIDEHGQYPYTLYDEEFESYIRALEEAEIDPDEKQYRFSSVETPEEKQGSANIEKLRSNGPTPSSELPQGRSTKDRQLGVWKFDMNSGSTQPADAMYYIHEEHPPELVLRRFFQHNLHVLEYRDAHGIKMAIKDHQPSWKEIGRRIVDELLEEGATPSAEFQNLVVIRTHDDSVLNYCFDSSVSTVVDVDELPVTAGGQTGTRPVWGFPRETQDLWRTLSERDGLIFSTQAGTLTHYVPIVEKLENTDVMTELWVEYENGVRSNGIDRPWPYLVIGGEVQEIDIQVEVLLEEIGSERTDEPIQWLDEEALKPFVNTYGDFESYARHCESSESETPSSPNSTVDDRSSPQDVIDSLFQITPKDIPRTESNSSLGEINHGTLEAAFRRGIRNIYQKCSICGDLLESPDGSPDLEAARILPKEHDGPAVLQNGLGLCSRHHWAFTNGWFEIDTDYEIRLREYPELQGYDELKQYDGTYLHVPTDGSLQPHSHYIRQRNQIGTTTTTRSE